MTSSGPSGDAQGYLESLMRAGQEAMKRLTTLSCRWREWERRIIARRAVNSFPLRCLPISNAST